MRGLKLFCLIAGIVNILAGLLAWPLGFGAFTSTQLLISSNYEALVKDGKVAETTREPTTYAQHTGEVLSGLEVMMSNRSAALVILLVGQGCIFVAASFVARSSVPARQRKFKNHQDPNRYPPESGHPMC